MTVTTTQLASTDTRAVRVLLLLSSANIGGAERSLSRMIMSNQNSSIEYELATIAGHGAWSQWIEQCGLTPRCFGESTGRYLPLRTAVRLVRFCRRFRPQIIYVVGLRAALMARLLKPFMRAVHIVHGLRSSFPSGTALARKFRAVETVLRHATSHYIANSACGARDLRALIQLPADRLTVIYNGLERLPQPVDQSPREPLIVVIANITSYKGHFEFLRVIARVREQVPDVKVAFVGRNEAGAALHEAIEHFGLRDTVQVLGFDPDPQVILARARVFALPSLVIEGCPTAILEAMAHSLPVVAYRIGGIPELVAHERTGLLPESGDESAFANGLVRLLADPALARSFGAAGRDCVRLEFTLERCGQQHAALWFRLCSGRESSVAQAESP